MNTVNIKTIYLKITLTCFVLFMSFSSQHLLAITHTTPTVGGCISPTATIDQPYSVQLTSSVGPGNAFFFYEGGADLAALGLALNEDTGEITGTPTISSNIVFTVRIENKSDDTDFIEGVVITLCVERKPIDVIFCLDISGSMNTAVVGCASPPCDSRLRVLQTGFDAVMDAWLLMNSPSLDAADRVGVIYFESDASAPPTNLSLGTLNTSIEPAKDDVGLRTAGGSTAMGAALQEAIQQLSPEATRDKAIILFTDGDQNRNPMVNTSTLAIENDPGRSPADGGPNGTIIGADGAVQASHITIYTIGIGSNAGAALLDDIAAETGVSASLISANDFEDDLNAAFIESLVNALNGGSPQIAMRREGNLSGQNASEKVMVNKGAEKVTFILYGNPNDELSFTLFKDGVNVTFAAGREFRRGTSHSILSINLPTTLREGGNVEAEGEWEMRIRGGNRPNAHYQARGIIEEKNLKYQTSLGQSAYQVGDDIEIKARVAYAGSPINDAQVSVTVLRPGDDIGDLLANTQIKDGQKPPEQQLTPAEQKFALLINDPEFAAKLGYKNLQTFDLTPDGKGGYTGSFSNTDITGAYRVLYTIQGEHPDLGRYVRLEEKTTVVNFGSFDEDNSAMSASINDNGVVDAILIRPRNTFNRLMGPGMTKYLTIKSTKGQIGQPVDNLDGSYRYPVTGLSSGELPEVKVTIFDKPVFQGQIDRNGPVKGNGDSSGGNLFDQYKWWIIIIILILVFIISRVRKSK